MNRFKFWRKLKGGVWYKHSFTTYELGIWGEFWARYGKINRYTDVVKIEEYGQ